MQIKCTFDDPPNKMDGMPLSVALAERKREHNYKTGCCTILC